MSVLNKLASSLGRRDEEPNKELAKLIADTNDKKAIKELVDNLNNKNKEIQSDCIKVLYETGEHKPALLGPYAKEFIALFDNKNNRLQWGAMTAIDALTLENPETVYSALAKIIAIADKGTVITNDHCVGILIKLCSIKKYADAAIPLLFERLVISPTNQLPSYAEKSMPIINDKNKKQFIKILNSRIDDIEKDTKRKRVEKVIKKLS